MECCPLIAKNSAVPPRSLRLRGEVYFDKEHLP